MKEEIKALIAIPANIILSVEIKFVNLPVKPLDKLKIIIVVIIAKKKETGVIKTKGKVTGKIKINIAPSPAPAEIPRSPGSARLFLSIDCKIIPEHESEAPTMTAFNILGSRISSNIFLFCSLPEEKMFRISEREIETLPSDKDIITETNKSITRKVSMKTFLDNN